VKSKTHIKDERNQKGIGHGIILLREPERKPKTCLRKKKERPKIERTSRAHARQGTKYAVVV
jgi:hypothetical protein